MGFPEDAGLGIEGVGPGFGGGITVGIELVKQAGKARKEGCLEAAEVVLLRWRSGQINDDTCQDQMDLVEFLAHRGGGITDTEMGVTPTERARLDVAKARLSAKKAADAAKEAAAAEKK